MRSAASFAAFLAAAFSLACSAAIALVFFCSRLVRLSAALAAFVRARSTAATAVSCCRAWWTASRSSASPRTGSLSVCAAAGDVDTTGAGTAVATPSTTGLLRPTMLIALTTAANPTPASACWARRRTGAT